MVKSKDWKVRYRDAPYPWQDWNPFPKKAIVQIQNKHRENRIGPVYKFCVEVAKPELCVITYRMVWGNHPAKCAGDLTKGNVMDLGHRSRWLGGRHKDSLPFLHSTGGG